MRGYDGSVLEELERRDAIEATDVVYDVVGPNPLHPQSLVRWRAG